VISFQFLLCVFFHSLQSIANDVIVVWRVFSLPVLEPMTRTRLYKIVSITMSCLYASLAAATTMSIISMAAGNTQLKSGSTSKDEETDGFAGIIVQKTVCFYPLLTKYVSCLSASFLTV